jgi:signal transduction histidine kinase
VRSIRLRALLGAVVTAWMIFAVLAVVDFRTIRDLLVYHFDDELRTHAGTLVSLVRLDGDRLIFQVEEQVLPFYRNSPKAEYFEVWDGSGRVMRRSESLGDRDLPAEWGTPEVPRIGDLQLPDGRPGRGIGVRFVQGAHTICIGVAEPRQPLDDALAALVVSSAWTAAGLGIALAALLWFVLRTGLRPLQELSVRVAKLDVGHLPERVGMGAVPVEIAPVVARLDELLGRVRAMIARERRVTSNIAHELMTPLAELRALSDVAMRLPDDMDYQRRAAAATNETAMRMQAVAEKVMDLATAESGGAAPVRVPTDLAALLREVVGLARVRGEQRSVAMLVHAPDQLQLETDPVAVRVVLDNLVQNAAEHAPSGSEVRVELASTERVVFTVRNVAPELTPEDVPRLTEPYWRKDTARTSGTTHAGIGLALARELAEQLGGGLTPWLEQGVLAVAFHLPQAAR